MKTPEVGDIATLTGTITQISGSVVFISTGNPLRSLAISKDRLSDITSPPWEPKIGDRVKYRTGTITYEVRGFIDDQVGIYSTSGTYYLAKKDQLICAD